MELFIMKNIIFMFFYFSTIYADGTVDIGFRYGFLSKPTYDSDSISILSDSSIIHTGDYLRINIGYLTETNICVIYKSADGEYLLLHNEDKNIESKQDTSYFTAFNWGDMGPPPGTETFYFINSFKSLADLITLLNRYDQAPSKGQAKLAIRIQDKINSFDPDIQDDLSSISSQLDKPVAGGVSFRGEDDGIKDLSVTHECLGVGGIAFKKIVLIHQ